MANAFRGPGKSFLMPPVSQDLNEQTLLDISHESLMRVWERLDEWVDEEGRSARIYRRLAETASMHEQGSAGYLREPELGIALNWREETQPNAAWATRYGTAFDSTMAFLEASVQERDRALAAQEAAQRREVRRLRLFIGALATLLLLALGTAGFAVVQQQEAQRQRQQADEQRQEAERQKSDAEIQRQIAEDQELLAEQRAQDAQDAQDAAEAAAAREADAAEKAQQAAQQAERARRAEASQRQEAQRQEQRAQQQANEARAATDRAEIARARAERGEINADILAQSLRTENLFQPGFWLRSMLQGIETGKTLHRYENQVDGDTRTRAIAAIRHVVYNIHEKNQLRGHSSAVYGVSFSPDGETIASASSDGTVKLWNRAGEALHTLEGHSSAVVGVSFSPDGQTIASASWDGTVKLWNRAGEALQTLEGHSSAVYGVSFSPDGQTIASASWDGTVKLWNFDLDDLLARGCAWLRDYLQNPNANLSDEERRICDDVGEEVSSGGVRGVREASPEALRVRSKRVGFWERVREFVGMRG